MNTAFQIVAVRLKPLVAPPHAVRGAKLYYVGIGVPFLLGATYAMINLRGTT